MTDETTNTFPEGATSDSMLALTAQIVAAYISKNAMPGTQLPTFIDQVFQSLAGLGSSSNSTSEARPDPAVPVKKSVFPDHIVCLEDGKKLKMLKRHLMTSFGMTPEAYRERWGLPSNYPMVAPNYAERRSALAKSIGLGRKPGGGAAAKPADAEEPSEVAAMPKSKETQVTPIPKTRGRKLAKTAEAAEE